MNDLLLIALTPLIVLLILALFRFTACAEFTAAEAPPLPPTPPPPVPPAPKSYAELIASTKGFAAHWPLDETGGNQVKMVGPLSTVCQYEPTGTVGRVLGKPGAFKSGPSLAPEFDGTAAYVEVPFIAALNPLNTVAFSVELWVKPNPDVGVNTQVLISSHHFGDKRGYEILLTKVNNQPHQRLQCRVFSGGATTSEVAIQLAATDGDPKEWRYIVMTYQGNSSGVDGKLTLQVRLTSSGGFIATNPTAAYAVVSSAGPATLRFGSSHKNGQAAGNFFAGQIDEVAFYNAALPQTDQDAHFDMAVA